MSTPENSGRSENAAYGSIVTGRAATLKELVRQDALGQSREFTAKMVAARTGADRFRVAAYLDAMVASGELRSRVAISPNRKNMETVYGPPKGRGRIAS